MRDYLRYRLHLALKQAVTAGLHAALALRVAARPAQRPRAVTGSVVVLDRCLGLGDALMMSPALSRLAALGPVTVVAGLPPLLAWEGDWRRCADWAAMTATVQTLSAEGRLVLVPKLGVGGLLTLLRWPGRLPAGAVRLGHRHWLDTVNGRRGAITGQHYTDGALACTEALLERAGHATPDRTPPERLPPRLPAEGVAAVLARLKLPPDRPLVTLAPWATSRIRRWPVRYWQELIGRLAQARPELAFVLLGSADEQPAGAAIAEGVDGAVTVLNVMGRGSLADTAAVIAGSALLVASDNGLMHLGLGVGTPLVAVFGSTDPNARLCGDRWRLAWQPALCPHRLAPCYPDLHRDPSCPTDIECLTGLSPEHVAGLALDLLSSSQGSARA
jgi:ADP-heptose:LPS heptosyltransferase